MSEAAQAERAALRSSMRVRVYRLGEEPPDNLSGETTAEQRLLMVAELSARMWALTGKSIPTYSRAEMPVRVIRGGDATVQR